MAALEDSFLRDLEDLSDDSGAEEADRNAAPPEGNEVSANASATARACHNIFSIQMDTEEVDIGTFDSLESRARLQSSERYTIIMEVSPSWPNMACTSALLHHQFKDLISGLYVTVTRLNGSHDLQRSRA